MIPSRFVRASLAAGLAAASVLVSAAGALAQVAATPTAPASIPSCQFTSDTFHPLQFCSSGQTYPIPVPSGGTVTYSFNYPGDNSVVTFFASIDNVSSITASAIGVNVYDTTRKV